MLAARSLQLIEPVGAFVVNDVVKRAHGKVAPKDIALVREAEVTATVFGEAVLAQVHLARVGILLCLQPCPVFTADDVAPGLLAFVEFDEFSQQHFQAGFVPNKGGEFRDTLHVLGLAIGIGIRSPPLLRTPKYELLFFEEVKLCSGSEERAGILLLAACGQRQFPDGHGKALFQGEPSVLHYIDDASPVIITLLGRVSIIDEAEAVRSLAEDSQLLPGPCPAERCDSIVNADRVQACHIGSTLHTKEEFLS